MLAPASKPALSTKLSALGLRHMAGRVRPRLTTYYNCTATRYSSTLSIAQRIGLRIKIEQVPPLEEAAKVHERVEAGHTRGKIVLRVG